MASSMITTLDIDVTGEHPLCAGLPLEHKGPARVEPRYGAPLDAVAEDDLDPPAHDVGIPQPGLPDGGRVALEENPVPPLRLLEESGGRVEPLRLAPGLDAKGRGRLAEPAREIEPGHVDVQPDADDDELDPIPPGPHLRQHAADLFPADEDVVGPLEPHPPRAVLRDHLRDGHARHQRDERRRHGGDIGPQEHGKVEVLRGRRFPDPVQSPPAPGLRVGHDDRALGRALLGQAKGLGVGRFHLFEILDPHADDPAGKEGPQLLHVHVHGDNERRDCFVAAFLAMTIEQMSLIAFCLLPFAFSL